MSYKNLTQSDVESVARDLMRKNGKTTTLEIKNELRADGFYATQDEVAGFMYTLWEQEEWGWVFNGTYRVYFQTEQEAVDEYKNGTGWVDVSYLYTQPVLTISASGQGGQYGQSSLSKLMALLDDDDNDDDNDDDDDGVAVFVDNPLPGDWKVFMYGDPSKPTSYVRGTCSKNAARQLYYTVQDVSSNDYFSIAAVRVG